MTSGEPWYSVRALFEAPAHGYFEERITMWRAESAEQALGKGEAEAREYAKQHGYTFTGFIESFHLAEAHLSEGTEVFSLLRDSPLESREYISRHLDTGGERRR